MNKYSSSLSTATDSEIESSSKGDNTTLLFSVDAESILVYFILIFPSKKPPIITIFP